MMIQTVGPSLFQGVRGPLRFESSHDEQPRVVDSFAPSCQGFDVDSIYLNPPVTQRPGASNVASLTAATLAGLGSVVIACSHFNV